MKRIVRRVIPIAVTIAVSVIGNLVFSVFIPHRGLENSSAAFAGNQDIDIIDALAGGDAINNIVTWFNVVLGLLCIYFLIRLIITSITLYKEHRNICRIMKEEL